MNTMKKFEPIAVLIWGLVINLLIANGYLLPTQKDLWVNGGLELISALGSVSLFTVYLHHTLTKHSQQDINNTIQGMITSVNKSPTTGSVNIPVSNPKASTIHVNVP